MTEYLGVVTAQGVLGVNAFKDVGAGSGHPTAAKRHQRATVGPAQRPAAAAGPVSPLGVNGTPDLTAFDDGIG